MGVTNVAISNDSKFIVSGSDDKSIKIWDWDRQEDNLLNTLSAHDDSVNSVSISNDGSILVSGSDDKTVKIWCRETGKLRISINAHENRVT